MGSAKYYNSQGGFSQYEYHHVGEVLTASNGVQGKVIEKNNSTQKGHDGLPLYTNTSEVYFKMDDQGNHSIEQGRAYDRETRHAKLDFDWNHPHGDHEKGVVHVHEWYINKKGEWERKKPRCMNNEEIARYGELIKLANPDAKLRP